MEYLKVEGHNNLIRDPNTNSIINTDMSEYQQYLSRRSIKNDENQKIQNLEQDVDCIKDDLNEIKTLLRRLVNGPG
jgi:hypothetical protein